MHRSEVKMQSQRLDQKVMFFKPSLDRVHKVLECAFAFIASLAPTMHRNPECHIFRSPSQNPWRTAFQALVASEEESNFGVPCAVVDWLVPVLAEAKTVTSVEREEPVGQQGSFGRR